MKDLTNPTWIKLKGFLFLFLGLVAATLLFLEHPTLKAALLLVLALWCFCRFYYFAFYVACVVREVLYSEAARETLKEQEVAHTVCFLYDNSFCGWLDAGVC